MMTERLTVDFTVVRKDWMDDDVYRYCIDQYRRGVQTPYSAGLDLMYLGGEMIELKPGDQYDLETGLRVAIPAGWCGLVVPRSGLGRRGFRLRNTVGVIDSDYRGEILMCIEWVGRDVMELVPRMRIGQMVVIPCLNIYQYQEALDETDRGSNGFGSTGLM